MRIPILPVLAASEATLKVATANAQVAPARTAPAELTLGDVGTITSPDVPLADVATSPTVSWLVGVAGTDRGRSRE